METETAPVDVRAAARAFVLAAFESLRAVHVIPTPRGNPFVEVGRDYFGDQVQANVERSALERVLEETYPHRFDRPERVLHVEFAATYTYALLEACIDRCGIRRCFDEPDQAIEESIDELISVLEADSYEVVCCRVVSHVETDQTRRFGSGPGRPGGCPARRGIS